MGTQNVVLSDRNEVRVKKAGFCCSAGEEEERNNGEDHVVSDDMVTTNLYPREDVSQVCCFVRGFGYAMYSPYNHT